MKTTKFFPLIKNFKANTIFKAFIINAFIVCIISGLTIEFRLYLEAQKKKTDFFFVPSDKQKIIFTVAMGFIVSIICYLLFFVLIGYGGGLISIPWNSLKLF
jgi:hypothetical protein